MRILVVNNLYPPVVFGGYEILCQQVVERLKDLGHELEVITSDFRSGEVVDEEGVYRKLTLTTNFPLPGENVGHVDFSLQALHRVSTLNEPGIEWRVREFKPDVIFCWCLSRLSLAPVWVAQQKGIPVCYTVNDEHARQFKYVRPSSAKNVLKWLRQRWLYPKATLSLARRFPIACISQALKKKLLAQHTQVDHAEVIYQGIPLEKFPHQPTTHESGPFQLLYVGQVSKTKGVHTLFKALSEVNQQSDCPVQLRVVGSGVPEYRTYLEDLATELAIQDQIRFLGRVEHHQVSEFYRSSHAFVFPSEWDEPFGLTHLEAMASGAAVISTTTGGSAELIHHEENALAFEAGCAKDLAQQVLRLIKDEKFRIDLVQRARQYVEEKHSIDVYSRNLEAFLRRTCRYDD